MRRAAAIAIALLVAGDARARSPQGPSAEDAGTRDAVPPADAVIAQDAGDLARLVADASGPRDVWLRGAVYRGDLRIERPLALHGVRGTVLEGSGTSTVVAIDADDVAIENVVVRGSGHRYTTEDGAIRARGRRVVVRDVEIDRTLFGISFAACQQCRIERVHVIGPDEVIGMRGDGIKVWQSDDVVVKDCRVERSRDVVVWYSRRATLSGNVVTASRYGTHFMYAHDGVVTASRLVGNTVGIFVMYSRGMRIVESVLAGASGPAGVGIGFKESDDVTIARDWIVANTAGVYLDRTPRSPAWPVAFDSDVFALDRVALRLHGSETGVSVHGCDFRDNDLSASVDGGGDALALDVSGNHWSDYEGYDLDGDGRGDVAYEQKKLSSDVKEAHPSLRLLEGTVALGLVDAIAEATPLFASRKLLVDSSPLVRAPEVAEP